MTDSSLSIVAANVQRIIDSSGLSRRAWALKRRLDVKMIERVVKGSHSMTLGKLEEIARAIGVEPWQLLLPDLDPVSPPDAPISEDDRKMLARLRRLLDE